jgi:toxin ParE1/3/4
LKRLIVSPEAEADLRDIAGFIADDNPTRARTFVAELRVKMQTIAERPLSFPSRDEWHQGLRVAFHGRYCVILVDFPEHVRIVRVLDGARDLARIFEGGLHWRVQAG